MSNTFTLEELKHIRDALQIHHLKIRNDNSTDYEDNEKEELHHEVWDLRKKVKDLIEKR